MTTLDQLVAAESAEKADLATLSGLVTQIVAAVANGSLDQAKATALLADMTSNDATVKGAITSIQGALGTAPPPPPPTVGP